MMRDDQQKSSAGGGSGQRRRPVEAAFRVQEVLAEAPMPLGVSEVSRRSRLPKSTVARILADLTESGIAERVGVRYVAGRRLLSLVDHVSSESTSSLRRLVLPYLVQLHDQTGLAVAFATLRYGRVHYMNVMYSHADVDLLASVPLWGPAQRTASGKVLLAFARSRNGARLTAEAATDVPVDRAALSRDLWRVRHDGVAYHNGEYVDGLSSVAVGLFAGAPFAVGAMAVCGSSEGFDAEGATAALRHVARAAGSALRIDQADGVPE